jgi:FAD/FMN-containing dehydrogenase
MTRTPETSLAKLEELRNPHANYVVRVSDPRTEAETAEIKSACRDGRRIAVLPRGGASIEEWIACHRSLQ